MLERGNTADVILSAARGAIARHGLNRVTLEDVARDAGVTRQTVHRHYGTKRGLMAAVMEDETDRFIEWFRAESARHGDLRSAMRSVIELQLRYIGRHEMFQRMLETEPETLLTYLATDAGPVLSRLRDEVESVIAVFEPGLIAGHARCAADGLVRLVMSYSVSESDLSIGDVAAGLADIFCEGLHGVRH